MFSFSHRDVDDDQQNVTAPAQPALPQPPAVGAPPVGQGFAVGSAASTSTAGANLGMVHQQQQPTGVAANIGVAGGATANPAKPFLSQSEG